MKNGIKVAKVGTLDLMQGKVLILKHRHHCCYVCLG